MVTVIISVLGMTGYLLLTSGILLQIRKAVRSRSVKDIAVGEVRLRTLANVLTCVGMVITHNWWLLTGALINLVAVVLYCCLVLRIRAHPRR